MLKKATSCSGCLKDPEIRTSTPGSKSGFGRAQFTRSRTAKKGGSLRNLPSSLGERRRTRYQVSGLRSQRSSPTPGY
jgi:hypothetical protein